jgi:hypothetical protein
MWDASTGAASVGGGGGVACFSAVCSTPKQADLVGVRMLEQLS